MENETKQTLKKLKQKISTYENLENFLAFSDYDFELTIATMDKLNINFTRATELFNYQHSDIFNPFIELLTRFNKSIDNMVKNIDYFEKINLKKEIITIYLGMANISYSKEQERFVEYNLRKFDQNLGIAIDEALQGDLKKISKFTTKLINIVKYQASVGMDYDGIEQKIGNLALTRLFIDTAQISNSKSEYFRFNETKIESSGIFMPNIPKIDIQELELQDLIVIDKLVNLIVNSLENNAFEIEELSAYFLVKEASDNKKPKPQDEPKEKVVKKENIQLNYKELEKELKTKIIGQENAIDTILKRIKIAEFGVSKENGAKAVYLLVGPTGVGKTEIVKLLANNSSIENNIVRIDMSEYQEAHSISRLLGAPAGYVGYEEKEDKCVFAEIASKPTAIILLDEIEKAHPDILDLFLHVFDEGKGSTRKQQKIDFKNNQFFLTSNLGTFEANQNSIGFNDKNIENKNQTYKKQLEKNLRPEFLNRIDEIIYFKELTKADIAKIIDLKIDFIKEKIMKTKNIELNISYDSEVLEYLISKMEFSKYGAREVARTIEKHLVINIANYFSENGISNINLNLSFNGEIIYNFEKQKQKKK